MAFHAFMQLLYSLQHYPTTCTASVADNAAPYTPSNPVHYVPWYLGNCGQAFVLTLEHLGSVFSFNG